VTLCIFEHLSRMFTPTPGTQHFMSPLSHCVSLLLPSFQLFCCIRKEEIHFFSLSGCMIFLVDDVWKWLSLLSLRLCLLCQFIFAPRLNKSRWKSKSLFRFFWQFQMIFLNKTLLTFVYANVCSPEKSPEVASLAKSPKGFCDEVFCNNWHNMTVFFLFPEGIAFFHALLVLKSAFSIFIWILQLSKGVFS